MVILHEVLLKTCLLGAVRSFIFKLGGKLYSSIDNFWRLKSIMYVDKHVFTLSIDNLESIDLECPPPILKNAKCKLESGFNMHVCTSLLKSAHSPTPLLLPLGLLPYRCRNTICVSAPDRQIAFHPGP